jgi:hydroxymethylglutaryl-CoA lyase
MAESTGGFVMSNAARPRFPSRVKIVEVGPRDGLQNEARLVPTATKIELIDRLSDAGLSVIEATAFVSAKWVPQMADSSEVMQGITRRPGTVYPVLAPNLQGFDAAIAAGATEVAVFAAASESFSRKNINCSVAESLKRFEPVIASASALDIKVRGYVSCVVGCPYEGAVDPKKAAEVAAALFAMGCHEVSLGDTIGVGNPASIQRLIATCTEHIPIGHLAGHYHDTYGMAIANIYASLEMGMANFDSAIAGLGGCPYAPGAAGNVASEDVVYLLDGLGIESGIDLAKLAAIGDWISSTLNRPNGAKAGRALCAKTSP